LPEKIDMDRIAAGSATDRRDLFGESASRLGMNPAIVEKDFWVCWILKHLFAEPALKEQMVFKGGTSLSKVFGLIERFSEDIDLILDWRLLGYGTAEGNDPNQPIQSKDKAEPLQPGDERQGRGVHSLHAAWSTEPAFRADPRHCRQPRRMLTRTRSMCDTLRHSLPLTSAPKFGWRLDRSRPGFHPAPGRFSPYAATSFPKAFAETDCAVVAIDAERTFWEKATILHQEAHRPGTIPARYSRHYYDLYKLAEGPVKATALSDHALLRLRGRVQRAVLLFLLGALRSWLGQVHSGLSPPESQQPALERDYRAMRDMFYREPPEFADVLRALQALEGEINSIQ
jgi:hypothetical protein